jgi:putative endonuclease
MTATCSALRQAAAAQRRQAGHRAHLAGHAAEAAVLRSYHARGAGVVARRWRGQGGEIDLVLRDGADLVFVEVKQARSFARAAERLTPRQVARIMSAASEFLGTQPEGQATAVRFDLATVDATGRAEIREAAFGI